MSIQSELILPVAEQFPPVVETDLFASGLEAQFWLGSPAGEQGLALAGVYQAARIFRANSYINDNNFLSPTARQSDGGEMDNDDLRATHFVALENNYDGTARVVGNIRSILKRSENEPLPVEHYFPEAFEDAPAPVNAVEASRFIAKHPEKLTQGAISVGLMRSVIMSTFSQAREPIYAVVEAPLERRFATIGLPFRRIADPKPLEEYGGTINMGLVFDPKEILSVVDKDIAEEKIITHFFKTARNDLGLGYYDQLMVSPIQK
jgi:N-acyl-L-homoserine lactone synthetase